MTREKAIELKLCPFCGSEAELTEHGVCCTNAGNVENCCNVFLVYPARARTQKEIEVDIRKRSIEAWNKRVALKKPAVCKLCKGSGELCLDSSVGAYIPCPKGCKPAPTGQALRPDSTLRLHSGQASLLQAGSGQAEAGESGALLRSIAEYTRSPLDKSDRKTLKEIAAHIDRLEAELKQQYDKVFLEGTEAQEDANRKHIIEPLQEENKRLKEDLRDFGRHSEGCNYRYDKKYGCKCGWLKVDQALQGQKGE